MVNISTCVSFSNKFYILLIANYKYKEVRISNIKAGLIMLGRVPVKELNLARKLVLHVHRQRSVYFHTNHIRELCLFCLGSNSCQHWIFFRPTKQTNFHVFMLLTISSNMTSYQRLGKQTNKQTNKKLTFRPNTFRSSSG